MTERTPEVIRARAERFGVSEHEVEVQMKAGNLIGRLVRAQEVAWIVAFLCSPKATAINGDVIAVGGGVGGPIYY